MHRQLITGITNGNSLTETSDFLDKNIIFKLFDSMLYMHGGNISSMNW